jgi:DNA-binding transcriptional LysR family regulator
MAVQTEDLIAFQAVAREGSFGRAASSLLVSQPAVSERMARLEREMGATLFIRGARGTTLTVAGEHLLPYATRTVDLLDEAVASVGLSEGSPRFRVAVHVTFAHRVVPLVLAAVGPLRRSIKLRDAHSDEIIAMLLDGVADVGFVVPAARPRPLRFLTLPADPVVCVCAPSHPLAGRGVALSDLGDEHRLAFNRWGAGAEQFVDRLRAAGLPEWRWTECSDALTALDLARTQLHIAVVPASVASERLASGEVLRLDLRPAPKWSMPLVMACRASDESDPAVQSIRAAVQDLRRGRHRNDLR